MSAIDDDDEPDPRTIGALADAAAITGAPCQQCRSPLCGHEAVFCLVLGYKGAPRCLACVVEHAGEPRDTLRERALQYVQHQACFHAAWKQASSDEASADPVRPVCVFGDVSAPADVPARAAIDAPPGESTHASWDAGGMGCGDLVLELRLRLAALAPGGLLDLRATDPGAPKDLPAWCNLTGNTLVEADHPRYVIRRKG